MFLFGPVVFTKVTFSLTRESRLTFGKKISETKIVLSYFGTFGGVR
jgi:hypothetical protein